MRSIRKSNMNDKDHDLLIKVAGQINNIEKLLGNHLAHSDKRELLYLSVILGSVATALIAVCTSLL